MRGARAEARKERRHHNDNTGKHILCRNAQGVATLRTTSRLKAVAASTVKLRTAAVPSPHMEYWMTATRRAEPSGLAKMIRVEWESPASERLITIVSRTS